MIIWFWHQIVPSSFCCDKFSISMVFHIFHIFSKNCIIHQLKKIFFKISFLLFFLGLCASQYTILVNHYEFYEIFFVYWTSTSTKNPSSFSSLYFFMKSSSNWEVSIFIYLFYFKYLFTGSAYCIAHPYKLFTTQYWRYDDSLFLSYFFMYLLLVLVW